MEPSGAAPPASGALGCVLPSPVGPENWAALSPSPHCLGAASGEEMGRELVVSPCSSSLLLRRLHQQQTPRQQHLHHRQEERGRSRHALPVPEAHQRHLGAGRAQDPAQQSQLHGTLPSLPRLLPTLPSPLCSELGLGLDGPLATSAVAGPHPGCCWCRSQHPSCVGRVRRGLGSAAALSLLWRHCGAAEGSREAPAHPARCENKNPQAQPLLGVSPPLPVRQAAATSWGAEICLVTGMRYPHVPLSTAQPLAPRPRSRVSWGWDELCHLDSPLCISVPAARLPAPACPLLQDLEVSRLVCTPALGSGWLLPRSFSPGVLPCPALGASCLSPPGSA